MAITLSNADSVLKDYYLGAITEQLDYKASAFYSKVKKTSSYVYGKEVKKLVTHGINGGIGAGTEDGSLPAAKGNNYAQMTASLKNLYGTIEISDKALRASENSAGAFANLLTAEMEGLVKAGAINLGRMLYGDGSGKLGKVVSISDGVITFDAVENFVEGTVIDFRTSAGALISGATGRTVIAVDRDNCTVTVSGTALTTSTVAANSIATVQGSYQNEITGLGAIFGSSSTLYGLSRESNPWLTPIVKTSIGTANNAKIIKMLDDIEERSGNRPNLILCSYGVRRSLYTSVGNTQSATIGPDVAAGFTTFTYNGIPIVGDRFCPKNTMYFLNTDDFELHQLCDWQWLESDEGRVLKQVAGKPVYSATLVKYAELICTRPFGQGVMLGVTEA